MNQQTVYIASGVLSADIAPLGAELQSLRDSDGRDLLWNGDPAVWNGRAPILFPIVGALNGNGYEVDGARYELSRHGFARRSRFEIVKTSGASATFRLTASEATRAVYPFDFQLDIAFAIVGVTLAITATLGNPGDRPLPASFGYHPAFLWPLPYGADRADHQIIFEKAETAPLLRLDKDGLIEPEALPSPIAGNVLELRDDLFAHDALIFDALESRRLRYGPPDGPGLTITCEGMPHLGIWTKPGAGYVCIEPWQGHADPQGFAGSLRDKPGVIEVAPGGEREFRMTISV